VPASAGAAAETLGDILDQAVIAAPVAPAHAGNAEDLLTYRRWFLSQFTNQVTEHAHLLERLPAPACDLTDH
jgi:hypothetical protein